MASQGSVEHDMDRINRRTYGRRRVVRGYGRTTGWLDPGEKAAIDHAVSAGASGPLLDIGIGGGRTVPLMQAISPAYTGIDYVPAMVRQARRNAPGADLRVMDARELVFADTSFGLVTFSFNGIDSVDEAGRETILREVHRVLRPGGFFVFSALNHHGLADRALPLRPSRDELRRPKRLLLWPLRALLGWANLRRHAHLAQDGQGRSRRAVNAHAYGLIGQYTSVAEEYRELERHGFTVEACFDSRMGSPLTETTPVPDLPYLHYVARKPA